MPAASLAPLQAWLHRPPWARARTHPGLVAGVSLKPETWPSRPHKKPGCARAPPSPPDIVPSPPAFLPQGLRSSALSCLPLLEQLTFPASTLPAPAVASHENLSSASLLDELLFKHHDLARIPAPLQTLLNCLKGSCSFSYDSRSLHTVLLSQSTPQLSGTERVCRRVLNIQLCRLFLSHCGFSLKEDSY